MGRQDVVGAFPRLQRGWGSGVGPAVERGWAVGGCKSAAVDVVDDVAAAAAAAAAGAALLAVQGPSFELRDLFVGGLLHGVVVFLSPSSCRGCAGSTGAGRCAVCALRGGCVSLASG